MSPVARAGRLSAGMLPLLPLLLACSPHAVRTGELTEHVVATPVSVDGPSELGRACAALDTAAARGVPATNLPPELTARVVPCPATPEARPILAAGCGPAGCTVWTAETALGGGFCLPQAEALTGPAIPLEAAGRTCHRLAPPSDTLPAR
jgi:hypothetical protein